MYLVDTDVISEARKGEKGNLGVRQFFRDAERDSIPLYLSVITIGSSGKAWRMCAIEAMSPRRGYWNAGSTASRPHSKMRSWPSIEKLQRFGAGFVFRILRTHSTNRLLPQQSSTT
jgi:hypothetical protein